MFRPSMRVVLLVAAAGLLCGAIGSADEKETKDEPPGPGVFSQDLDIPFGKPSVAPEQVKAWREKHAVQSLRPRLAYERRAGSEAPPLGETAAAALTEADRRSESHSDQIRAKSLELLHTAEVDDFIHRSGNGIGRMIRLPQPGPDGIEYPAAKPLELAEVPPLSEEERSRPALPYLRGERAASLVADDGLSRLPTRNEVVDLNRMSRDIFADPRGFGWVRGVDRVVGFREHAFKFLPSAPLDAARPAAPPGQPQGNFVDPKRWKIARLELVSLLKHDEPCVYVSDHLPRMEELSSATAPTRELNAFERAALDRLRDGEEVQTSSTPNRIEMLGAVRASKACMQCHEVPRGTMLGAFSYELRRDPPIKVDTAPVGANVQ